MRYLVVIICILYSSLCQSQKEKETRIFFDTIGQEVSPEQFYALARELKNISLFFTDGPILMGFLIPREHHGQLQKEDYSIFTQHLTNISGKKVDTTKTIVIDYLSAQSKKKRSETDRKSSWRILTPYHAKKLKKITNGQHYWIYSPENYDIDYYRTNKINWLEDKNKILEQLFFAYEVQFSIFLMVKPDGRFMIYYGEYGEYSKLKGNKFVDLIKTIANDN
ncbi:hypothetical protein [Aquimarina sp. 2201CG14-23]|uniref:hypothetical protein n=1 Tax=Aquimarina mycalae TaxID=3040073 RepID=UPI00247803DE|nr:hypothetical protein [Aquimarina sp. 2201CG14-23]MDH7444814.1 hypothetical protein [Aquimarina sp. 2201CG14-23]